MSRFDYRALSPREQKEMLDTLCETLSTLRKKEDVEFFLKRLLTPSEIVMLVRRLQIAEFLITGRTYDQIRRKLGVGVATIINVDRWLTDAAHEYQLIREEYRQKLYEKKSRSRRRNETTVQGTLKHLIRHNPRFILIRILLGDF